MAKENCNDADESKAEQQPIQGPFYEAYLLPPRKRELSCGGNISILNQLHQFGELRCDVCHRLFCRVQAASRAKERTDVA